jgi:hypothetical protein
MRIQYIYKIEMVVSISQRTQLTEQPQRNSEGNGHHKGKKLSIVIFEKKKKKNSSEIS